MKIELQIGENKVSKDVSIKRRKINDLIKAQFAITKADEEKQQEAVEKYNDLVDKISAEAVGMKYDDFIDLDEEECAKVTSYINTKVKNKFDFSKP